MGRGAGYRLYNLVCGFMDLEFNFSEEYVVCGVFCVLDYRCHLAQARVAAIYSQARPPLVVAFWFKRTVSAQATLSLTFFRLNGCNKYGGVCDHFYV